MKQQILPSQIQTNILSQNSNALNKSELTNDSIKRNDIKRNIYAKPSSKSGVWIKCVKCLKWRRMRFGSEEF